MESVSTTNWTPYFRNLLYLRHDDLFSFPPKQAVQSSLGDFFVSYAKIQKNI